ncbi:hypothetical protein Poli38472_009359 [Pythium oligandrum]|uniref:Protein kinase domain-containing protein n=1 Tax=Pythium oligandrum TaxID=41045 RepID=A0A8K1FMT7_PYTOL|nr:hypothetical protein Poli38472_009359 [Pythium oligandrum]|eukprot:TMW65192.1 hypothetical protein Poli38472_009359 [Pythium oligandrum]
MIRRRRRRRVVSFVALLWTAVQRLDAAAVDTPGKVLASRFSMDALSTTETGETIRELSENVLTTGCTDLCDGVSSAGACLSGFGDLKTCEATKQMTGVTCQSGQHPELRDGETNSILCLAPEQNQWRFQFSANPELLGLGRSGIELDNSAMGGTPITLNASEIDAIENFALLDTIQEIHLQAADPTEDLSIRLSEDTIGAWRHVHELSIRNFDLSQIQQLPEFPTLTTLDLSSNRLKTWPIIDGLPVLSDLDISSNSVTEIPANTLPLSLITLNISHNPLIEFPSDIAYLDESSDSDNKDDSQLPTMHGLKELYLSDCGLSSVSTGLAGLPLLQKLDLSHNPLKSAPYLPDSLVNLNMRNTSLKKLPSDFDLAKTWEFIDISENQLSDDSFAKVNFRAVNLYLEKVGITSVPPKALRWAVGNTLSLSNNQLGVLDARDLPPSITRLHVASCGFEAMPTNLSDLSRLTLLDLSNNGLRTIASGSLPLGLTELFLSGCSLKKIPGDTQVMSGSLQTLDLSKNKLREVNLKNFTSLKRLSLNGNSLTALPLGIFQMTQLTHLDLSENSIANVTLNDKQVEFLSKLKAFSIDESAFSLKFSNGTECADQVLLRGKYMVCKGTGTKISPSSKDTDKSKDDKGGMSANTTRIINYIVAGFIVAIFIVAFVVSRRNEMSIKESESGPQQVLATTGIFHTGDIWEDQDLLKWRVNAGLVDLVMQLGSGAYRLVWLGRYRGESVLIKRLHQKKHDLRAFDRFIDEIKVLGSLRHPKITRLIGVSWTNKEDLQMIVEFMSHGDLGKYLASSRTTPDGRMWSTRKISIAADIAEALLYLHSLEPVVLHRDLKSRNVLLDDNYTAKISDFGMCRHRNDLLAMSAAVGTSRWIAPEVLSGRGDFSEAVDIYSFGVILSELDSHELPFSDILLSNREPLSEVAVLELLSAGALQPTISDNCPGEIAELMLECMSFEPAMRPNAHEVLRRLRNILDFFQSVDELDLA